MVEPLSLDEAYLDVTDNLSGIRTAWETAKEIRARILAETELTASAGVSLNKVPREARVRSAQAERPVRDHARRSRGLRGCASDREVSWRGPEDGSQDNSCRPGRLDFTKWEFSLGARCYRPKIGQRHANQANRFRGRKNRSDQFEGKFMQLACLARKNRRLAGESKAWREFWAIAPPSRGEWLNSLRRVSSQRQQPPRPPGGCWLFVWLRQTHDRPFPDLHHAGRRRQRCAKRASLWLVAWRSSCTRCCGTEPSSRRLRPSIHQTGDRLELPRGVTP